MALNSIVLKRAASLAAAINLIVPLFHADRIRDDQWHLRFLSIDSAHKQNLGEGVTVATVDTGVSPHSDLRKNLTSGTDLITGGNGQQDINSHGTSMAGLIAAHGNGSGGALGIAPRSRILPVRIAAQDGRGTPDDVAAGIDWAIEHEAKVISVSYAGASSARLRMSVDRAAREDTIVVAAAGNRPESLAVGFPAALDGVLAVGAVGRDGEHAELSVTGEAVAITAPGVDIYSTSTNNNYSKGSGTSAATAIVAGAAALVRSKYPELSAPEVVHRLTATATDKGAPGRDEQYGYGVLNLVAALTADVPPLSASAAPPATSSAATPEHEGGGRLPWAVVVVLVAAGLALPLFLWMRYRRREGAVK
ncbi:S8 family serine peptidase [Micromonospora sp. CPCC 206061]|uniref:S8 family serine peptidase n=1 Tax=Micromonospora sp. CPCC 206061 TaxID=3122410 RepID=UPI002FF2F28C